MWPEPVIDGARWGGCWELEKGLDAMRTGVNVIFVRVGRVVWAVLHCNWAIGIERKQASLLGVKFCLNFKSSHSLG